MRVAVVVVSVLGERAAQRDCRLDGLGKRRQGLGVRVRLRGRVEVVRRTRINRTKALLEDGGGVHVQQLLRLPNCRREPLGMTLAVPGPGPGPGPGRVPWSCLGFGVARRQEVPWLASQGHRS